jgi:hypothetical protein
MSLFLPERSYPTVFFVIVVAYCLFYAPYGINETDGGFLTGLAWQVLSGKTLYQDIIYVRPPLSVWLRALELKVLPEAWSVLGERYFFYIKVALYTWLASDLLSKGAARWVLAILGFIISVHSYPACAWHTIDGILCAVLALWLYAGRYRNTLVTWLRSVLAGLCFCSALLCKQSFYPLLAVFPIVFLLWDQSQKKQRLLGFSIGTLGAILLFFNYLYQNNTLESYLQLTGSAASGVQALQHGLIDYLRIKPALAFFTLILLTPVGWWFWKRVNTITAAITWYLWLVLLVGAYVLDTWQRQEFTAPFSQARLSFLVGVAYTFWQFAKWWKQQQALTFRLPDSLARLILLLAVCWSASVSWGYNLPILLATPWLFAIFEINRILLEAQRKTTYPAWLNLASIALLLGIARFGYEFVYRDGLRSEMTIDMGTVFPKLNGIYSSPETAALYLDLKNLQQRYGPDFAVLPAFPQAHFLTNTAPVLPLDWVVNREINTDSILVINALKTKKPVLFIEKSNTDKIDTDPELALTRQALHTGKWMGETPHFWIVRYE